MSSGGGSGGTSLPGKDPAAATPASNPAPPKKASVSASSGTGFFASVFSKKKRTSTSQESGGAGAGSSGGEETTAVAALSTIGEQQASAAASQTATPAGARRGSLRKSGKSESSPASVQVNDVSQAPAAVQSDKASGESNMSPMFQRRPRNTSAASQSGDEGGSGIDFLNTNYLAMLRDRAASAFPPVPATIPEDAVAMSGEEAPPVDSDEDFGDFGEDVYMDPYSRQFVLLENMNRGRLFAGIGSPGSELGSSPERSMSPARPKTADGSNGAAALLPFPLPLPASTPPSDKDKDPRPPNSSAAPNGTENWSAPESWAVTYPEASPIPVATDKTAKPKDVMSCTRVFRREGNFVTVSCSLNITAKELCAILARKFFLPADQASKYQLFVQRNNRELLIQPTEHPLRMQQVWLWELGYDPSNDRFQDILREDNSIIYRWIYTDVSANNIVHTSLSTAFEKEGSLRPLITYKTPMERKLAILVQMASRENPATLAQSVDISECNLDFVPVILFKHARLIRSLDMSGNLTLNLPLDFVQLCTNLRVLKLADFQLQRVPVAIASAPTIEVLDLSNNLITSLRDSGLQALVNLRELVLRNNRLIGKNAFPHEVVSAWSRLETLDVSCNWLKGELSHSLCLIGQPDASQSTASTNLLTLDFSYNRLSGLPADFGYRYPNLRELYLVSNFIPKLPESLRDGMKNLEVLDVRGNVVLRAIDMLVLSDMDPAAVAAGETASPSPTKLGKLILDNNQLAEIKISRQMQYLSSVISRRNPGLLQIAISSHLPALTTLVASASKMAFVPENIFEFTPNLQVLVLTHNQITDLPPSIKHLTSLVRLDLAHNTINKLPAEIKELQMLETLDLHGNNLKEIPQEIWELRVVSLNLSSNVIEKWPDNIIFSGPGLNSSASSNTFGSSPVTERRTRRPSYVGSSRHVSVRGDDSVRVSHISDLLPVAPLSLHLQWFTIADNRLETAFFENAVFYLSALRSLNVSHNEIFSIPMGTLRGSSGTLEELHLSGNHLTMLPDDIHTLKRLKRLYVSSNRLGSVPPEIGKIANLRVLDLGRNQLRYNVANWPYDWNWNWNPELRYLNLSGNPKLEIRPPLSRGDPQSAAMAKKDKRGERDADTQGDKSEMVKFDALYKLRVLGLLEVSLSIVLPEESPMKRVRVYAPGGASLHWKRYAGLESADPKSGEAPVNTTALLTADQSVNGAPVIPYGISDSLGMNERSNNWDLALIGCRYLAAAREEAAIAASPDGSESPSSFASPTIPRRRGKVGECLFALFEGTPTVGAWGAKWLNDFFAQKFSTELKKVFKERQQALSKKMSGKANEETDGGLATASDEVLTQHALRRTFLVINKHLGGLTYAAQQKRNQTMENEMARKRAEGSGATDAAAASATLQRGGYFKSKKPAEEDVAKAAITKRPPSENMEMELPREDRSVKISSVERASVERVDRQIGTAAKFEYMSEREYEDDNPWEASDEAYLKLLENGYSGLIAYLVNSQLFVANCGDSVAVLCRNGKAQPLSVKHNLFSPTSAAGATSLAEKQESTTGRESVKEEKSEASAHVSVPAPAVEKARVNANESAWRSARRELARIRHSGGYVSHAGLVAGQVLNTRSFGYYRFSPQINTAPYVSLTELREQDEFVIIGSSSFWRIMDYQTAIDIARLKADDALEASMVLRDFAIAYSNNLLFSVDDDAESAEDMVGFQRRNDGPPPLTRRYFQQHPISVMVIDIKEWVGGGKKKVFRKMKRRKDETLDSAIARLAPEVEPPTGHLALVFTDVRNSTNIWERMSIPMRVAIREHNSIMRRNLRHFGGYEVKTEGDAFMVAFQHVLDALRWCMTCQLQLLEADWPQELLESFDCKAAYGPKTLEDQNDASALLYRGLSVRMGVHCGAPVSEMDPTTRRMDYFGPMVNKSARVSGNADGGQILVSRDVEQEYQKLMSSGASESNRAIYEKVLHLKQLDLQLISVGEKKLKGFDKKEELFSVLPRALVGRYLMPPPPLPSTEKPLVAVDLTKMSEVIVEEAEATGSVADLLDKPATASGSNRESRLSAVDLPPSTSGSVNLRRPVSATLRQSGSLEQFAVSNIQSSLDGLNERLEKVLVKILSSVLEGSPPSGPSGDVEEIMPNTIFPDSAVALLRDEDLRQALSSESVRQFLEEFVQRVENVAGSLELAMRSDGLVEVMERVGSADRDNVLRLLKTLLSMAKWNQ